MAYALRERAGMARMALGATRCGAALSLVLAALGCARPPVTFEVAEASCSRAWTSRGIGTAGSVLAVSRYNSRCFQLAVELAERGGTYDCRHVGAAVLGPRGAERRPPGAVVQARGGVEDCHLARGG